MFCLFNVLKRLYATEKLVNVIYPEQVSQISLSRRMMKHYTHSYNAEDVHFSYSLWVPLIHGSSNENCHGDWSISDLLFAAQ